MTWDPGWEDLFRKQEWGKYPPEDLIRFIAKNFYKYPDRNQISILEIGCGPGGNIWYLAREGFSVYGIDGSRTAIEIAKNRLINEGLTANLQIGDILNLSYPDTYFDCVIDIECLYANTESDTTRIIKEIHRVLKPGGKFYSKTFMEGTVKPEEGVLLNGEERTYQSIHIGPLSANVGIQRLTSDKDIPRIYSVFTIESVDYLIRSDHNRSQELREYLICCNKRQ
jgi:SAM-dependent methyltransferase